MEQLEGLSTTTWSSCFNQNFLQGISKLIKKIIPPQCSNDLKSLGSERGGGVGIYPIRYVACYLRENK